jgi:hypothetical protein
MTLNSQSIYQNSSNDIFYIYAPPWRDSSAGIRVLHYLCHCLNLMGYQAWLVLTNPKSNAQLTNSTLNTPVLSKLQSKIHIKSGMSPVVVYSETILDNPLNATRVMRWVLNFPGALGGFLHFPTEDYLVAYSKKIQACVPNCTDVLFLPAVDLSELPVGVPKQKELALVYAGKYRSYVGTPPQLPGNPIELFRDGEAKLSRKDFLNELAKAEKIYLFENSSVATEAVLLNTVAIFVQNEFLGSVIAESELGNGGLAIGFEKSELERAKQTLPEAALRYKEAQEIFWLQLQNIVRNSKQHFQNHSVQLKQIKVPTGHYSLFLHRMRLMKGIIKQKGMRVALRTVANYLRYTIGRFWRRNHRF